MKNWKRSERVDIQVSVLAALAVILSSTLIFILNYTLSYRDMINGLQERVTSIYYYLEEQIDKQTFESINTSGDEALESYQEMQMLLQRVKDATGVRYLYTAKLREDGAFVYVVDGLPPQSEDFRHPGDLIEPEIQEAMREALNSRIVLPDKIKSTSWGHIFIAYLPIHSGDTVIGVLGIEFEAEHQYATFRFLSIGTPFVILLFCLIAAGIAVRLFRRVSNPSYRDLANTDMLTDLKNRNAFEMDLNNLNCRKQGGTVVLSADLDDLKRVNDTMGHLAGDQYILSGAEVLKQALSGCAVIYRIGGDEFAVIIRDSKGETVESFISAIDDILNEKNKTLDYKVSLSVGGAYYDADKDHDLSTAFQRADRKMYEFKREKKAHMQA